MNDAFNESAPVLSFVNSIKSGHIFFYDTEMDEVVHFRKDIFEAAQRNDEEMDLELTEDEEFDAEDAWDIVSDEDERYLAMPPISDETIAEWEQEFSDSGLPDWKNFHAEKYNALLLNWLAGFDEPNEIDEMDEIDGPDDLQDSEAETY